MQVIIKTWGAEQVLVNGAYCGKILHLSAQMQCSLHRHIVKDETFYVITGLIELETGPSPDALASSLLGPGDFARITPSTWHRFASRVGATMAEFSTHHDDADVERHEPSRAMSPL